MDRFRARCLRVVWVCALACLLPVAYAATAMHGVPLLRHFGANQLPAAPTYPDVVIDRGGNLYAASGEGVMIFRSGVWELLDAPGRAPVYSLLLARDGSIYVAGEGIFGQLRQRQDGTHGFVDLLPRLASAGSLQVPAQIYSLGETSRGVHAVSSGALFVLNKDGSTSRRALTMAGSQRLLVVGDEIYFRIAGEGLYRMGDAAPERVAGTQALANVAVTDIWKYQGGLLVVAADGFHFSDGKQLRKLKTDADAAFRQHGPYTGVALADGGFVIGSYDGTVMRFSPDLRLLDSFMANPNGMHGLVEDREGGLWVVGENGLTRIRLSSPWTRYDQSQGLAGRLYDSAWYDGRLWVASLGVWRADPLASSALRFSRQPWPYRDLEVFALQGTAAGLVIGDRHGLMVLEPGARQPRRLLDTQLNTSVDKLLPSAFDAERMLASGAGRVILLGQRNGRWQVMTQWPTGISTVLGMYEVAPGEVWAGDAKGDVHRWRFDPDSGQLHEHRRFGAAQGLEVEPARGTRLFRSEGVMYAISGAQVRKLDGERFVSAELPALPGLASPGDLEGQSNEKGSFVWTSRQLWWRKPGTATFQLQQVSDSRVPGFSAVALHGDGQVRVVTRDSVLQLDAEFPEPATAPPLARLDRIELQQPGQPGVLLPLSPETRLALPAGAGLALRFGIQSMEPDVAFRYRMPGYHDEWSAWSAGRELTYQRLPAGDFTFQLQARIQGGVPTASARYPLQVAPFWYQRGWAWGLFGIVGVLFITGVVHLRNRSANARLRELERKIAERTTALQAANSRLSALVVTDGLTGIANRHAMEKALQRAWQRCAKRGEPLAVMMIDVDHFKRFNDTNGHHMGDQQLRRVAGILAAETDDADELVARYGGEEFVVILPGSEREVAATRAERLRSRVEQASAEAGLPVTISVGVAVVAPLLEDDPMALVRCADQALYRVKRNGRNRVEVAELDDWAAARA
ncbi:ligand-binding sensor domain-containing diguanylate cyclase [Stenotrophomonas sp. Iso1]|uniref:ligand-binding sensor domain-containing diguanylate cyclase n=1 Tax=Stenotrophomonas sp. Iso1 TaxID=2977283 RepID=UPI0022B774B4|nr:ligand-binding sensor domain-containing diguanylate cyclase [Stenotrophomonas sp. Iso1]